MRTWSNILLFFVFSVLLIILSGCYTISSDIADQIPTEQVAEPIFSPNPSTGPFENSVTITLNSSDSDAVIFFAGGNSVDFDPTSLANQIYNSVTLDSAACATVFQHFNQTLYNDIYDIEDSDSWMGQIIYQVSINTLNPNTGIAQSIVDNCLQAFGGTDNFGVLDFTKLMELNQSVIDDCLILYEAINDSVQEDLESWMNEIENFDNATLQQCNEDLLALNESFVEATASLLYTNPITISRSTIISALAYKDGQIPSNVVTKEYVFSNEPACSDTQPCGFGYSCNNGQCEKLESFECVVDANCDGGRCVQGVCQEVEPECQNDYICGPGRVCNALGQCVDDPNYVEPECTSDDNCTGIDAYCNFITNTCQINSTGSCIFEGCPSTHYCNPTSGQCIQNPSGQNIVPQVILINPAEGDVISENDAIIFGAAATDFDGTIQNVSFFYSGSSAKLGTVYQEPYIFLAPNFGVGNYKLWAIAFDNESAGATSNIVNIRINASSEDGTPNVHPVVELTTPSNGDTLFEGESLPITATASDEDGSIVSVQFFESNDTHTAMLYEDLIAPYSYTWINITPGNYYLVAKAKDNNDATKFSNPVLVNVVDKELNLRAHPSWLITEDDFVEITCDVNAPGIKLSLYKGTTLIEEKTDGLPSDNVKLSSGNYTYRCTSNDSRVPEKSKVLVVLESDLPPKVVFDPTDWTSFFNFSDLDRLAFKNLRDVFFEGTFGSIKFTEFLNISRNIDLRDNFKMTRNTLMLDSTQLPEFNKPAFINFFNVNMDKPVPFRNNAVCPSTICTNTTYNKTTRKFSFFVSGFSNYSVREDPACGDDVCDDDETCENCNKDCGICGTQTSWCHPSWNCTEWSACREDGHQIRNCEDIYECDSLIEMPATIKVCGTVDATKDNETKDDSNNEDFDYSGGYDSKVVNDDVDDLEVKTITPPDLEKNTEQSFDPMIIVYAIIGLALIGGAVWFFFFKNKMGKEQTQNNISPQAEAQVSRYIDKMKTRGYGDDQIRTRLKSAGWTDEQLNQILRK